MLWLESSPSKVMRTCENVVKVQLCALQFLRPVKACKIRNVFLKGMGAGQLFNSAVCWSPSRDIQRYVYSFEVSISGCKCSIS